MLSNFTGENLIPGYLGQFFIYLCLISSILSLVYYIKANNTDDFTLKESFKRLGRITFFTHIFSIIGVFIVLFYIIFTHSFEYYYAYRHSSTNLPFKYILASFWEGSEGSFLLWLFWQAILSLFVIFSKNGLEIKVMSIINVVQILLTSMVLGIYIGESFKLGSSPFILLRHQNQDNPLFQNSEYMKFVTDGNGLNPLLQNYWMTIHPPVLFLGFAASLFPAVYAIAALWNKEYKTFLAPAIKWSLITGAFLGLGIMLGGAWAYESLTFGGYWAWDPVENASLVPWLIIIAGLHTLIIFKSTGRSLKISLIFLALTYLFVWYSTFLTRTGVLGETSVHAFTDSGKALYYHILFVLVVFIGFTIYFLVSRWKKLPQVVGEETIDSREFWMLIGSVILLFSSLLIIFYTSTPLWSSVWKSISGSEVTIDDPVNFYNKQQIWFAILIAILSGAIQFLKYKKTPIKKFWIVMSLLVIISSILTFMLCDYQKIYGAPFIIFAFSGIFAVFANIYYLADNQKFALKKSGGAITHFGFGLMIIAILLSSYNKEIISLDRTGQVYDFGKETFQENLKESRENVLLFRNTVYPMGDYKVTYLGDSVVKNDPPISYYKLRFEKRDLETNELIEQFYLYPSVFINEDGTEGMGSNPDAKHYWNKDVFTYVTSTSDPNASKSKNPNEEKFKQYILKQNDTLFLNNGFIVYEGLESDYDEKDSIAVAKAKLHVYDLSQSLGYMKPQYIIKTTEILSHVDSNTSLGVKGKITKIDPVTESVEFDIFQKGQEDDFVVIKVTIFPFIGILWLSIALLFIGFMLSYWARRK